jgi:branched-chain amino acid transport system permease protein
MIWQVIVSGLFTGLLYALIAFGFQLTYATSKTANFGQGSIVMLGGLLAAILTRHWNYFIALPVIVLVCASIGILVERLCIAPSLKEKEQSSAWIVSTIALGIAFNGLEEIIFGTDELAVASPFPDTPWTVLGIRVLPHEIFIGSLVLICTFLLTQFYRSKLGKSFEAVACDRYAAELQGIPADRIVLISYVLSSALAGLAGWALAPITGAGIALDLLGIKSFCAAVVGSLSSTRGALLAGILIGILENLTVLYIPSGYRTLPALLLCAFVITFRPTGLFGQATIKKV